MRHERGHGTNRNELTKTEVMPSTCSDHNGMKLETNYKKITKKYTNTLRLNNMLLNNEWVNKEIKRYVETNENENMIPNL